MKKQSKMIVLIIGITLFTTACGNQLDEVDFLAAVDTAVAETDTEKAAAYCHHHR